MKLLDPYVNHYVNCPFYSQEKILRSGVPMNGSCFFYSLYYGFKTFRDLNDNEKLNFIKDKRKSLSDELTIEKWLELQNGSIALLQFSSILRIMIYTMTFLLECEKEVKKLEKYGINIEHLKILNELLTISIMDKKLFPRFDMECIHPEHLENDNTLLYHYLQSTFVSIYKTIITEEIDLLEMNVNVPKWSEEKKSKIIDTLSLVSNGIFSYVCNRAINDFKEEIRNVEIWLNIYQFYYVLNSTQHNMNIFIIDANTMLPYVGLDVEYDENLPCVVILYFSDHHFESMGIEKKKSKKIYRTLPYHDPFIQAIVNYLDEQKDNLAREFENEQNDVEIDESSLIMEKKNVSQEDEISQTEEKSIKSVTDDKLSLENHVDNDSTKSDTDEQSIKSQQHETLSNLIKEDNICLMENTIST